MDEETKMQMLRLDGRCLGLTIAMASLAAAVSGSEQDAKGLMASISHNLDAAARGFAEPDSAEGQGLKDVEVMLRDLIGQIGRA